MLVAVCIVVQCHSTVDGVASIRTVSFCMAYASGKSHGVCILLSNTTLICQEYHSHLCLGVGRFGCLFYRVETCTLLYKAIPSVCYSLTRRVLHRMDSLPSPVTPFMNYSKRAMHIVIYGHCLVTLPSTIHETIKWLTSLPILMRKSFWWWQCSG